MGRKRTKIDLDVLRKLAGAHLTQGDIAAIMGMPRRTLEDALARGDEVRAAYDEGRADTRQEISGEIKRRAMAGETNGADMLLKHLHVTLCEKPEKLQIETSEKGEKTPGMSGEATRRAMAKLMGENPNDPLAGTEDDGTED